MDLANDSCRVCLDVSTSLTDFLVLSASLQWPVASLGKQVCLLHSSPPWGRGAGGAELLQRF